MCGSRCSPPVDSSHLGIAAEDPTKRLLLVGYGDRRVTEFRENANRSFGRPRGFMRSSWRSQPCFTAGASRIEQAVRDYTPRAQAIDLQRLQKTAARAELLGLRGRLARVRRLAVAGPAVSPPVEN
jgi:hypothetical protein